MFLKFFKGKLHTMLRYAKLSANSSLKSIWLGQNDYFTPVTLLSFFDNGMLACFVDSTTEMRTNDESLRQSAGNKVPKDTIYNLFFPTLPVIHGQHWFLPCVRCFFVLG